MPLPFGLQRSDTQSFTNLFEMAVMVASKSVGFRAGVI